jgi:serine/threonine protein kinase
VFSPTLPCNTKKVPIRKGKKGERTVGKVFFDEVDFNKEVNLSTKVAQIDKAGKTMLVPLSTCKTTDKIVRKHPAAKECTAIDPMRDPESTAYQLIMPYGGVGMNEYLRNHPPLKLSYFLDIITPLFDGLLMLSKNKVCHQDIKTSNILITPNKKAIYIDFGLMLSFDDMYSEKNLGRLKYSYFPYPPEYKVAYLIYKKCSDCSIIDEVRQNIVKFGETRESAYHYYFSVPEIEMNVIAFHTYISRKAKKKDIFELMHKYSNRVDVYGLGTALVDASRHIHLPSKFKEEWIMFVRGMIHPDVRKRFSPKKAHRAFRRLKNVILMK